MKQMEMKLPLRGGKRQGAGRKPKNGMKAGVSHAPRPQFKARHPVHVTMRVRPGVGFLRGYSRRRAIEDALREVKLRFGMRVVHYSIQGNHLHFILESDDPSMLSRAVQGLAIRLARALNRIAGRGGKVFADRFHAHVMKTLREVVYAVRYVIENVRHPFGKMWRRKVRTRARRQDGAAPGLVTRHPSVRLEHGCSCTLRQRRYRLSGRPGPPS
jgi:REP element-mobilizing transposase RayT